MTRVADGPHEMALRIAGLDSQDITRTMRFPATNRELVELLQIRLVVFEDRIDVKAVFPIEPVEHQSCTLDCRRALLPVTLVIACYPRCQKPTNLQLWPGASDSSWSARKRTITF